MLPFKPIYIESYDSIKYQLLDLFNTTVNDGTTRSHIVDNDVLSNIKELKNFLLKNNLDLEVARFFVTEPNYAIEIHQDGSTEFPKFLALNLPILNCNNSYMRWWDNVGIVKKHNTEKYAKNIDIFDGPNKIITHQLELISPHLLQIGIPHDVINCNDSIRVILSLRFQPEPLHLWY